jgi:hypothetical protein
MRSINGFWYKNLMDLGIKNLAGKVPASSMQGEDL